MDRKEVLCVLNILEQQIHYDGAVPSQKLAKIDWDGYCLMYHVAYKVDCEED